MVQTRQVQHWFEPVFQHNDFLPSGYMISSLALFASGQDPNVGCCEQSEPLRLLQLKCETPAPMNEWAFVSCYMFSEFAIRAKSR